MFRITGWFVVATSLLAVLWTNKEQVQTFLSSSSEQKTFMTTCEPPPYCKEFQSLNGCRSVYTSWREFDNKLRQGNFTKDPLIVFFYSASCPFSKQLWPQIEGLARAFPFTCTVSVLVGLETPKLGNYIVYAYPSLLIAKDATRFVKLQMNRSWEELIENVSQLLERKPIPLLSLPHRVPKELFNTGRYYVVAKWTIIFIVWLGSVLYKWPELCSQWLQVGREALIEYLL